MEEVKKKGNPNFGKHAKPAEAVEGNGVLTTEVPSTPTETLNTEIPSITTGFPQTMNEPMIPASQVGDLVARQVAEALAKYGMNALQQAPAQPVQQIHNNTNVGDIDEIPELQDWELKDRIYILCNDLKPISYSIAKEHTPNTSLTYTNLQTKTVHPLRFATNQISFFSEKQTKELGSVQSTDIIFQNGMLKVPASNIILQKFLAIHPHLNKVFKLYDPTEGHKALIEEEDLDFEAKSLARKVGDIANRSIASLVCSNYIEDWTMELVKAEIYAYLKKNPKKYIELANDPTLKAKGIIKTAMSRGYITYRNYKFYNERNEVIIEVQRNENEYDALADYFATGQGRSFYDYIVNSVM